LGNPNLSAIFAAFLAVRPYLILIGSEKILSGLSLATSSIYMPPSLL